MEDPSLLPPWNNPPHGKSEERDSKESVERSPGGYNTRISLSCPWIAGHPSARQGGIHRNQKDIESDQNWFYYKRLLERGWRRSWRRVLTWKSVRTVEPAEAHGQIDRSSRAGGERINILRFEVVLFIFRSLLTRKFWIRTLIILSLQASTKEKSSCSLSSMCR